MSSFKDNFTRGQGDKNLQYDDTAFYYFAISILTAVSLLLFFFIVKRILNSSKDRKERINPNDLSLKEKLVNQGAALKSNKYNKSFLILVIFFAISLFLTYQTSLLITKKDTMKRFDPYEILEISRGATLKEIRSAYKKMMIMYHPDKNPSPEAAAKFLLVTKANECLTDESKRSVCEQFGSPDGPGSLQVAIAMPSLFQKKENHVYILAFFSLVFIVVLPASVVIWLNRSQAKNSHGMSIENYKLAFQQLSQNMAPSKLIEIIGFSEEFKFPISKSEQEYFRRHTQFLEESYPSTKGIPATKAQKLLILRFEGIAIPAECQKELDYILQKAPCIIDSIIDQCLQINSILPKTDKRYMSVQSLHNVIFFQQHFFQGLWSTKTEIELNQFSPVYADQVSLKKLIMRYRNIRTLQTTPKEARKYDLTNEKLPEDQKAAIVARMDSEVDALPQIAIEVEVLIDQETNQKHTTSTASNKPISITIETGQIIAFKVAITFLNYPEETNKEGKFALTHRYPYFKDTHMHIYITEKDHIIEYSLLTGQKRNLEFTTKKALPEGEFNFDVFVSPDCFIGLNQTFRISTKVTPRTEKPNVDDEVHPFDIEKASEPNFIEKLLLAQQGGSQQQDDDEEEDEVPASKEQEEESNKKDD